MVRCRSDPTRSEIELVAYKIASALVPVLTFLNSPANLVLGIFSLDLECAGDKPGGIWLSPTSRLGTGGFLYPCVWPSVSPPLLQQ